MRRFAGSVHGMNAAILSATSALFGSLVGAMSSLASTWLTQHLQMQVQRRTELATKRAALYDAFLGEAAARFVDGITHTAESLEVFILLYAAIGRMRLTSLAMSSRRRRASPGW